MFDPIWLNADEFFRDFGIFVLVLIGIVCLCGIIYGILFALFEHFLDLHTEIITKNDVQVLCGKIVQAEFEKYNFNQSQTNLNNNCPRNVAGGKK